MDDSVSGYIYFNTTDASAHTAVDHATYYSNNTVQVSSNIAAGSGIRITGTGIASGTGLVWEPTVTQGAVMHKSDCCIDLNGIIDNEISGPYVYCTCGILVRVTTTTNPLEELVAALIVNHKDGESMEASKVLKMRETITGQLDTLTNLKVILDRMIAEHTADLRDWAADVDPDLPAETVVAEH